jgi:hypothetical protein
MIVRPLAFALLVALFAAPLAAGAQPPQVPRIGILVGSRSADRLQVLDQFRQELRKHGRIEDQTVSVLELRSAEGRNGQWTSSSSNGPSSSWE